MPFTKLPGNGAGSQITVTNTATSLLELIRTASGDGSFEFKGENIFRYSFSSTSTTDIRYFVEGSIPTTTNGEIIEPGDKTARYGMNLNEVRLIVTTGTTALLDISIGTFSHGQPADNYGVSVDQIVAGTDNLIPRVDTPATFEDTSFVVGDSPAILDVNTALGRNASEFSVINDGAGDFTVSISNDGVGFGDENTVKSGETYSLNRISVDSIRITHVADSSYRVVTL